MFLVACHFFTRSSFFVVYFGVLLVGWRCTCVLTGGLAVLLGGGLLHYGVTIVQFLAYLLTDWCHAACSMLGYIMTAWLHGAAMHRERLNHQRGLVHNIKWSVCERHVMQQATSQ